MKPDLCDLFRALREVRPHWAVALGTEVGGRPRLDFWFYHVPVDEASSLDLIATKSQNFRDLEELKFWLSCLIGMQVKGHLDNM